MFAEAVYPLKDGSEANESFNLFFLNKTLIGLPSKKAYQ